MSCMTGPLAVRVRMTRCHLACLPLILPALLSGARSISTARRPLRSSGPGIYQRSSGSGWLIAGPSWSRYVPIRRGSRHAWKSSAACSSPAIRVPSRSPAPPLSVTAWLPLKPTSPVAPCSQARARRELSADELERSWAAGAWTRAYDARYQHAVGQPVLSLTENGARERLDRAGIG